MAGSVSRATVSRSGKRIERTKLRRVYDAPGVWCMPQVLKADGPATVLVTAPGPRTAPRPRVARESYSGGRAWRIDISARNFSALVGQPGRVAVEASLATTFLSYEGPASNPPGDYDAPR